MNNKLTNCKKLSQIYPNKITPVYTVKNTLYVEALKPMKIGLKQLIPLFCTCCKKFNLQHFTCKNYGIYVTECKF